MFKTKSLLKAFIMLSYLLIVNSLNSGLHQSYSNNQQQDLSTSDNNDELGGSLLEVVLPSSSGSASSSNLFAVPPPPPPPQEVTIKAPQTQPSPPEIKTEVNSTSYSNNSTELPPSNTNSTVTNTTYTNTTNEDNSNVVLNKTNASSVQAVTVPEPKVETVTKIVPVVIYANNTCEDTNTSNLHAPYSSPDTTNMRYLSILSIIIFGSSYLILRGMFNLLKDINKFFAKGIKILFHQLFLLFMCISFVFVAYSYGLLDKIKINWQYVISGVTLMVMGWFVFCLLILFLSLSIIRKWEQLESNAKDFTSIKRNYEAVVNNSEERRSDVDWLEVFEFLVLKKYFCFPLFPVFKASSLRKEIKFTQYLKYCLMEKLRLLFKLSWTCWFITIFLILSWSVFVAALNTKLITIMMMCTPLIGLIINLILFFYIRKVYRRVVQVTEYNISDFNDVEYGNFNPLESLTYPVYLQAIVDSENNSEVLPRLNFHSHFHNRTPSLYEDQIAFGSTGFHIVVNILQAVGFIFVAWSIILFCKHFFVIKTEYGMVCLAFMIPALFVYLLSFLILITICLKRYTLISSIEMRRNEKCVVKTINYHLKVAGEMSESIFCSFKKLYYDIHINHVDEKENRLRKFHLGSDIQMNLIKINLARFKNGSKEDDNEIDIETELKPFLKSCGNNLTDKEIEFMLHFIENHDKINRKLHKKDMYDICGAIFHFRVTPPHKVIEYVFEEYYNERRDIQRSNKESRTLKQSNIDHFLSLYSEYFTKEQMEYIKQECFYLGETFSLDAFIHNLLSTRKYHNT